MQTLKQRLLWTIAALLLTGAGYTAGFLLLPRDESAVSRTLPEAPVDAPAPHIPSDTTGGV
jgi:hypothetical protein